MLLMAASRERARALTVQCGNCNSPGAISTRPEAICSFYAPYRSVPNRKTRELLGSVSLGVLLALGSSCARAQSAPTLYVTNQNNGTVSAISTSANTVTSTISGGLAGPWGAAASGDDSFVYTVSLNGGSTPGYVSVIDTATDTLTGAHVQVGNGPTAIALTPNGKTAYVTNENSNTVSVINTATNTVIATIPVGTNPFLVAVSPNGSTVYVSNNSYTSPSNGSVSVINTATNTVVATVALGSNDPAGLAVTPDGSKLYVTNTGNVTVINTATNTIASTIAIPNSAAIAISPNGATAYVLSGNSVSVVNTATNAVVTIIPLGTSAIEATVSPDGTKLYVTELNNNAVAVINTATNTITSTISLPAGAGPLYPAICSNGNALLATGLTFKANTSGALGCTLASGATGASGPVFAGGTLQFSGANISSSLPIRLMSQGGAFDTAGNNAALSGTITGSGGLTKIGAGTLTLSGAGTYSGPTSVYAGTLRAGAANVLSANSAYAIASGAALDLNSFSQIIGGLSGTGAVVNSGGVMPTLTMVNGGIFAPGNGAPGSSMAIAANLAFQSGAIYLVQVNPSTSSFNTVSGTAMLGGATVHVNFWSGTYLAKQYTILQSAGLNGTTFSGLSNTGLPAGFTDSLSYTSTAVFLNLTANIGGGGGLNGNQQNAAKGINSFFNAGGTVPVGFLNLFNLSGAPLANALTQISGETATGSQQTTFNAMGQFMGLMTDPFMNRSGGPGSPAPSSGYADEARAYAARSNPTDVFAMFTKAPPAPPFEQRWAVWAAGFGGSQNTDGNTALGSNNTISSIAGTAVGADYLISLNTIAGFALAGGGTSFGVANGGSGHSDLFQAGAYLRHTNGPAYVSASLAYGWQDITTSRALAVAGFDQLRAQFNANAWSGRLEGGYRFVAPVTFGIGITPYASAQFVTFDLPAYAEQAIIGTNNFALSYGARDATDARTEVGIRTDKSFATGDGILTLRGRFAWAHDYDPDRSIGATFQSLPGASFVVNGAAQAADSALTTASIEMKWKNNWSVAATFEGEFSDVTSSYAGKGVVRYVW